MVKLQILAAWLASSLQPRSSPKSCFCIGGDMDARVAGVT